MDIANTRLALSAGAVALALALAGCGGGGSSSTAVSPSNGTAATASTAPEPAATPPTLSELTQMADDARMAAVDAREEAEEAQADATRYAGMLTTSAVGGDSVVAGDNAQMALDRARDAQSAYMTAKEQHEDAVDAYEKAEAMEDVSEASLADIEADVDAAEEAMNAAEKARDAAFMAAMLDPEDDTVSGLDPEKISMTVATAMAMALMDGPGAGELVADPVVTPHNDAPEGALMDNDEDVSFSEKYAGMLMTVQVGSGNTARVFENSLSLASMTGLTTTGEASLAGYSDVAEDAETTARETSGVSFMGVSGKFVCMSGACSVADDAGVLKITGKLYFSPDDTDSHVGADDPSYAQYGYWLGTNAAGDAAEVYTYAAAMLGTGGTAVANPGTTITGEATYTGSAMGFFARKVAVPGGYEPSVSGEFTADAVLTARFGGDDIAVNKQFQLDGEVKNLMHGDTDLGWTVRLGMVDLDDSAAVDSATGLISGATSVGEGGEAGSWSGTFYRDSTAAEDLPDGIVGKFDAHPVDGHIAGVFNAEKPAQ